jgi:small-conductance mechanosensitive channel
MELAPETVRSILIGSAVGIGVWLIGWLVTHLLLPGVVRLSKRSSTDIDDLLLAAVRPHVPIWFLALGAALGARAGGLDPGSQTMLDRIATAVVLLSATLAAASFGGRTAARALSAVSGGLPTSSLIQNVVRLAIAAIGAMVVLSQLGVAITPMLTALGVGSLAVALALQPTLANLFAGVYLTVARQIRIGDFIELENGQSGFVSDISWRTTLIHEIPNNMIIIPNSKLSEIIVRNYALPDGEIATIVEVGVSYGSDLAKVEAVSIETGRETLRAVDGGVATFEPFVRFKAFGDSSVQFTVTLRAKSVPDRTVLRHEFIKRLHQAYANNGIEQPFPQRVVHVANGGRGAAGLAAAGPS